MLEIKDSWRIAAGLQGVATFFSLFRSAIFMLPVPGLTRFQ